MISILVILLHVLAALALILIVLLQVGKGQSIGAAFGGAGSSQTFFGSRGPATFLSQMTTVAAALFMVTSLALAYMSSRARQHSSLTDQAPITESVPAPPMQPLESVPTPTPPAEQQK
jgi:preprotein translocase subunit SecG